MRADSDKMENFPKDNSYSTDISHDQPEKSVGNPLRSGKQNLLPAGEHASENQRLPGSRSTNTPSRPSVHTSKSSSRDSENINQLDEASSSTDIFNQLDEASSSTDIFISSRSRSRTKYSRCTDALLSPRQNPTASFSPVLLHSDTSGTKTNRRDRSPLGEKRTSHFVSPPERVPIRATRSHSNIPKETNTTSPEKRSVEKVPASTPTKRMKKTPEIESGKAETINESYRSKLRSSADSKTLQKSPTNIQTQEMRASARKVEESESLTTPSMPSKGKRKIIIRNSAEFKTASDTCKSNLQSPSSASIIVHKSATNVQTQESTVPERNVGESELATEGNTFMFLRGYLPTDFHSRVNNSNSDYLHATGNFPNLPANEEESTIHSNVSKEASSTILNLETGKQKVTQPASDVSAEGILPNLLSNEPLTVLHPTTITDAYLFSSNKDSGKRRENPPVSDAVVQAHLPEMGPESALHPLTDEMSSSSLQLPPQLQNSTAKNGKSYIKIKKAQDSSSVSSKETQSCSHDSTIETKRLKYSHSNRIILNPHLPATVSNIVDSGIETRRMKPSRRGAQIFNPYLLSSCHAPRPSNSSVVNVPHRILTLESSDENAESDESGSVSSTRSCLSNRESRHDSKKLSTSRSLRMLRRSVSDETLASRNLPHVHALSGQSNSLINSQSGEASTSRSLPKITTDFSRAICIVQPQIRRLFPSIASNTASPSTNALESRTQPGRSNQLFIGMTGNLHSNELSTARNSSEVQTQRNRNDPLLQRHARTISGEASTSRHQPAITGGNPPYIYVYGEASTSMHQPAITGGNPPYIDVYEGDASTSRHQPLLTDSSFSLVDPNSSTSRNRPTVSEINPPNIQEESSRSEYQPLTTNSSSDDEIDSASSESPSEDDRNEPIELHTSSCAAWLPAYASEAHLLLQSILREMILHNGDHDHWRDFAMLFRRISKSSSWNGRRALNYALMCYLAVLIQRRGYVSEESDLTMPIDLYLTRTYESLIGTVIMTLTATLAVHSDVNFDDLIFKYVTFRMEFDLNAQFWMIHNIENIENEASRCHLKNLKKMIQRLLLAALTAFRLLLMYVGENADERSVAMYEGRLVEEDKIYLRRNS